MRVEVTMNSTARSELFRVRYIFALVISFFVFELYLFLRSFPAEYNIYLRYQTRIQTNDPFWTSFWFGSELTGEVGLIFRFVGVCFLAAFSWVLVRRGQAIYSYLKRAVLLEGVYYLFMIPFILSLYLRPEHSPCQFGGSLIIYPANHIHFTSISHVIFDSKKDTDR